MRKIAAFAVAFAMAACATNVARAAEPFAKVRTYAMTWLHIPSGVRSIGMGSTGAADASGVGTGRYNPASMVFADAICLTGSYKDYPADINLSEVVLSTPVPFQSDPGSAWRFAGSFGYSRLGMEPQTERTIFLPEGTGRTFDASDWGITALGAASWTRGVATIAAGATGKYLNSNLATRSATAWALDLGVLAAFPFDMDGFVLRPRAGYAVLNLDTGVSYDERKSDIANERRAAFGFDVVALPVSAWGRTVPAASITVDYDRVDREDNSDREYSAGFEFSFVDFLHFRYGTYDSAYSTYGLGVSWDYGNVLFGIDYAHEDAWFIQDTVGARIGMRW